MIFVYGSVADGSKILAEYSDAGVELNAPCVRILQSMGSENDRWTADHGRYKIYAISKGRLRFLCASSGDSNENLAFRLLEDLSGDFFSLYSIVPEDLPPMCLNDEYSIKIRQKLMLYNSGRISVERIAPKEPDIVATPVIESDDMIERIIQETESINQKTKMFKREPFRVSRRSKSLCIIIPMAAVLLVYGILVCFCGGFNLKPKCIK